MENTGWISTKNRLPELGRPVLVQLESGQMSVAMRNRTLYEGQGCQTFYYNAVAAWMPLPGSYREDKQEDEIVHCRECRHWKVRPGYGGYRTCKRYGYTDADFFCPWWKRL